MYNKILLMSLSFCLMVILFVGCNKTDMIAPTINTSITTSKTSNSKSPDSKVTDSKSTGSNVSPSNAETKTTSTPTTSTEVIYTEPTLFVSGLVVVTTEISPELLFLNFIVDNNIVDPANNIGWIEIKTDNPQWKTTAEKVKVNGTLKLSDIEGLKAWYEPSSNMFSFWIPVSKYIFKDGDTVVFDASFGTYEGKNLGEPNTWSYDGTIWSLN